MAEDTKAAARQRLIDVIPHLQVAMQMARIQTPDCVKVGIAVVAIRSDKTGNVLARIEEGEAFVQDLLLLVDDPELNELFPAKKV